MTTPSSVDDSTQSKEHERLAVIAALHESERRLSTLVSNLPGMAYRVRNDRKWTMEFVSVGVTQICGYSPADLTSGSIHWPQFMHPDDVDWTWRAVDDAAREHRSYQFEYRIWHKDGTEHWVWEQGQGVYDGANEPVAFEGFVTDITGRRQVEEARAHLAAIVESSDDAIISKSLQGIITSWNKGAEKIFGYTAAEAIGHSITMLLPPERLEEETQILASIRRGEKVDHFETVRQRKDGATIDISLTVSPIRDEAGHIIGASKIARDISDIKATKQALAEYARQLEDRVAERTADLRTANQSLEAEIGERRRAAQALEISQDELRRLSAYLQQAREEERRYMAREIHDELGPQLTGLKMGAARLLTLLPNQQTQVRERVAAILQGIDNTVQFVRDLATELRPGLLDHFGLTAAIEWQLQDFNRRFGIQTHLATNTDEVSLSPDACTAVFRVFQETLTNVARHSQATQVEVQLEETESQLRLRIRDNGRGISEEELSGARSLGLLGMRERVRPLAGEIAVEGVPGQGTTVLIKIPLKVA